MYFIFNRRNSVDLKHVHVSKKGHGCSHSIDLPTEAEMAVLCIFLWNILYRLLYINTNIFNTRAAIHCCEKLEIQVTITITLFYYW